MEYHVGYFSVLKSFVIPLDPMFIFVFFILPILLGVIIKMSYPVAGKYGAWLVFGGTLVIWAVTALVALGVAGSGWTLAEKTLAIKAAPESATIDLNRAQIRLIDRNSEWAPNIRTNGYGMPGLSSGNFKLYNNKQAICFLEAQEQTLLLIRYNEQYYVISHPNVEELYSELLREGVSKME